MNTKPTLLPSFFIGEQQTSLIIIEDNICYYFCEYAGVAKISGNK